MPEKAVVLGLARQGQAAAAALRRRRVEVLEADRTLGNDADLGLLEGAGVLVKSGGVPNEAPLVDGALQRGIAVWSDAEVAFRVLRNPLIGVTGTNGKTTTTALLAEMLGTPAAGNIGFAVCALDGEVDAGAWIACELSSFQLEYVHAFRPRIAVLLNLEPDHLDRHGSFDSYRAAKLRIFEQQQHEDTAIVPRGFGPVSGAARRVEFSADDPLPAEPLLRGRHNRENAVAATLAAREAGVAEDRIVRTLETFPGVPHRLELVAEVAGVRYVNDSKATNVAAARPALAAYADEPVQLILGGSLKGESFEGLAGAIGPNVRRAYLIGEAADQLAATLTIPFDRSGDLATAVRTAAASARPGEVVLFSPACASYDQFRDFEHRGEEFRRLVRTLNG